MIEHQKIDEQAKKKRFARLIHRLSNSEAIVSWIFGRSHNPAHNPRSQLHRQE